MKKLYILGLALFLFFHGSSVAEDVTLISSTADRVIIRFIPSFQGVYAGSDSLPNHFLFEALHCSYRPCEGNYLLPVRKVLLQIPDQMKAVFTVRDVQRDFIAAEQVPVIGRISAATTAQTLRLTDAEMDSVDFAQPVHLGPVGWLRHRQVNDLLLLPVCYDRDQRGFWFFRDMIVEIDFFPDPTQTMGRSFPDRHFEQIYSMAMINPLPGQATRLTQPPLAVKAQSRSGKKWYRFDLAAEGIYRLNYETLIAAGLREEELIPERLHIYYGGGEELSPLLSAPWPELKEIAIDLFDVNHNTVFDQPDALLFYAQGAAGWRYKNGRWSHFINHYNIKNSYWLCVDDAPPRRMKVRSLNEELLQNSQAIRVIYDRVYQELEKSLPNSSGLDWMWEVWSDAGSRYFNIPLADSATNDSARLSCRIQGLSETHHLLQIRMNEHPLFSADISYLLAQTFNLDFPGDWLKPMNNLEVKLFSPNSSIGFDWLELAYRRFLHAQDGSLSFYSTGSDGSCQFLLTGFNGQFPWVFDVSDPFQVEKLAGIYHDSLHTMVAVFDSVAERDEKRYLALTPDRFLSVPVLMPLAYDLEAYLKDKQNQADYLIITHESLQGAALEKLTALRQESANGTSSEKLTVMTVTTQDIYNQFSAGLVDPVAIRNFLKYCLDNWQTPPSYVLLIGEPSYDFKDNLRLGRMLLTPSYESQNQVSDDWLVNLTGDRYPDMIIGRLPVRTPQELAIVIDKIVHYERNPSAGAWQSRIILAADDINQNQHNTPDDFVFLRDSELLANDPTCRDFDLDKIYLTDYPWDRSFNKPAARGRLIDDLNAGALFVNFFGHANWNMLTHENLLRIPNDLFALHHAERLPLFYAGTCEIARIDDPRFTAMGAELLAYADGGVIACVGSSRWNMHQASFNVGRAFFRNLFDPVQRGRITVGQALSMAKIQAGFPDQTEIMFLLGDPAMRLATPSLHLDLQVQPDTLSALRRILVQGEVKNGDGSHADFSGLCELHLYDSAQLRTTAVYRYLKSGNLLYSTRVAVTKGQWNAAFFTPIDSIRGGSFARLTACAWSKAEQALVPFTQAIGALDSLIIRRTPSGSTASRDTLGPEIELSIAGVPVSSGEVGIQASLPMMLRGQLSDDGSGFVHPLPLQGGVELKIDDRLAERFLSDGQLLFTDPDRKKMQFQYALTNLALGRHRLYFTAYDQSLNRSVWELEFDVVDPDLTIRSVLNYPNPAHDGTRFTFELSRAAQIKIKIFTIAGRCIRIIEGDGESGFNQMPDEGWDGRDQDGDLLANGVYLYKIIAKAVDSPFIDSGRHSHEAIGKLVIAR